MSTLSIRNLAVIAHVDHGKTTLVDELLKQSGTFRENQDVAERAMDSMDLEREKGITIKSKNAAITWNDTRINLIDTPGHADFGGEVERIMNMVDGVFLLVDAVDGPQAQTRFVLRKAIQAGLKLVVFVNKVDREFADTHRVHDQVLELLMELEATEEQFNAPFFYGSARDGFASADPDAKTGENMFALFDAMIDHIPAPVVKADAPFTMLVANLDWSDYVGRIGVGKILAGSVKVGDQYYRVQEDGSRIRSKISKLYTFSGMGTAEAEEAFAGDIVGIAGFEDLNIGETICASEDQEALPYVPVDPPTITMQFAVNDGPFAGLEGEFLTARHLSDRLHRETRTNISLMVEDTDRGNVFSVKARGTLQIAVLVETMRREGYELMVSPPEVIEMEVDGQRLEPFEEIWIEVNNDVVGPVMERLANRKAQIVNMEHVGNNVLLHAIGPTRGIIGLETWLMNATSGEGLCSHSFLEYRKPAGAIPARSNGALVSISRGSTTGYALEAVQQRGRLFVGPGTEVYEGMVIGESARPGDLEVNPAKAKQLTNFRASGTDKALSLEPPDIPSLEKALEWIADDEYVEATPLTLRIRKRLLDPVQRKRANSARKAATNG